MSESFMQRRPDAAALFKQLLNPLDAKHGTQLITVHGEHLPGGKKTDDHGIKFVLCFLASSGTVNWADESVNQAALKQYNTILENEGFASYKHAIISGDASLIPTSIKHINPPPTLDELYLALAFRVSVELEFIDEQHQVHQQTENKMQTARSLREMLMVSDNETGFTDATKSKEHNFSTTLPVYQRGSISSKSPSPRSKSPSPRSKSGSPGSPRSKSGFVEPMIIEDLMKIMRIPFERVSKDNVSKDKVTLEKLRAFVTLTRRHSIVLPTKDCLEKRYSLTARYGKNENEHESFVFNDDDVKEKGYEHKLCLIIPYDSSESVYASHITSLKNDKYKFENTMHGYRIVGHSAKVNKHLKAEFDSISTEWNKCVIAPTEPTDQDIGFFQWKISKLGDESHLVINIWNLISRLEGTMGTAEGGIFISTTSETLQMCKLMGLQYVTGIDLTCVVPGMRSAGWVVLDKNSWDDEVRDVDSQIAHVHFIGDSDRTRQHVNAKDMRRNICKQLESVDTILDMFNATGEDDALISNIADATLKKTRHGKKYVYDEMFTMHYFFKGITTGPEMEYLAVRPPLSVLTDISTHLTKIEEFLLSYHSATTAQKASILTEYKTELRAILSLIKLHKITIASFKLRHDAGEIDEYTTLVKHFIRQPKALEELVIPDKLKEFTDIVKARLAVLGEDPAKITTFITEIDTHVSGSMSTPGRRSTAAAKKKGGKRNKTRKYRRHLKRRGSRRSRRGLRKHAHYQ